MSDSMVNTPDKKLGSDGNDAAINGLTEQLKGLSTSNNEKAIDTTKKEINMLLVIKVGDNSLIVLARELMEWILVRYSRVILYIEETLEDSPDLDVKSMFKDSKCKLYRIRYWNQDFIDTQNDKIDVVLTLGGDGTVLYVSSIFQCKVAPVMSFALGSLGFLTTFKFENFKKDIASVLGNKFSVNKRMRLLCKVFRKLPCTVDKATGKKVAYSKLVCEHHVLNEVTINRGPSPFLSNLELYGDGSLFTVALADGLIISTPTGSTAYSLSAGGSLVYPSVNSLVVTPICPNTLSFRPIILPETMVLEVKVPVKSRGIAWAAFDGKDKIELERGDYITVSVSPFAFPTFESSPTQYIDSIRRTLNWNLREPQKSFTSILSPKNRVKYETVENTKKLAEESEED